MLGDNLEIRFEEVTSGYHKLNHHVGMLMNEIQVVQNILLDSDIAQVDWSNMPCDDLVSMGNTSREKLGRYNEGLHQYTNLNSSPIALLYILTQENYKKKLTSAYNMETEEYKQNQLHLNIEVGKRFGFSFDNNGNLVESKTTSEDFNWDGLQDNLNETLETGIDTGITRYLFNSFELHSNNPFDDMEEIYSGFENIYSALEAAGKISKIELGELGTVLTATVGIGQYGMDVYNIYQEDYNQTRAIYGGFYIPVKILVDIGFDAAAMALFLGSVSFGMPMDYFSLSLAADENAEFVNGLIDWGVAQTPKYFDTIYDWGVDLRNLFGVYEEGW
ncbi:hypothetical protein FNT44_05135 [Listeria monocytogenes]|uniref:hypothetical protein n=1 Tax=Listeria monocytogenes TaxID=1639 RepID=UPI0010B5AB40|nr:hypothetical protein [Listeria monocytogenes]EAC5222292.1 hypothetical protein [Listeria monocytogenes]EAC8502204.1 hypothetical protein [Listeria monocytogenes]EAD3045042.1 hypothetical protein [Listeria monocytogenes]EAD8644159.1 hypothetical protein [Listeria monocytogenes]EAE6305789.1 hypothetical protein [Listeria monocytogenes]